jgi:hypothetical protein
MLAADFATMAGERIAMFRTFGATWMRVVFAATQLISVRTSRWAGMYGWSWYITRS